MSIEKVKKENSSNTDSKIFTKREWILRYSTPVKSMFFMALPMIIITLVNATYGIIDKQLTLNFAIGDVKHMLKGAANKGFSISGKIGSNIIDASSSDELIDQFARQLINVSTQYSNTIIFLLNALSLFTCVGTSIKWGQAMGRRSKEEMDKYLVTGFIQTFLLATVGLVILYFVAPYIIVAQADTTYANRNSSVQFILANAYTQKFILGFPILVLATFLSTMLRTEGKVWWVILINCFAIVINIGLGEFIMEKSPDGQKMSGAVYGSMVAWLFIIICDLIVILASKNTLLKFKFKNVKIKRKDALSIWSLGLSSFISNVIFSIANFVMTILVITIHKDPSQLNDVNAISAYNGENVIGTVYIVSALRVLSASAPWSQVLWAPIIGMMQGCNSNYAYNKGANKQYRMLQIFRMQILYCLCWTFIVLAIVLGLGSQMLAAFDGPADRGMWLFYYMCCFPLLAITITAMSLFQGTGNPIMATSLSISRALLSTISFAVIGWTISKYAFTTGDEGDKWLFIFYGFAEVPACIASVILLNVVCKKAIKIYNLNDNKDKFKIPTYLEAVINEIRITENANIHNIKMKYEDNKAKALNKNDNNLLDKLNVKLDKDLKKQEEIAVRKIEKANVKYRFHNYQVTSHELETKVNVINAKYHALIDRNPANKEKFEKLRKEKIKKISDSYHAEEAKRDEFLASGKKMTPFKAFLMHCEPQPTNK